MLLLFFFILARSEEHTSELQSHLNLVCRLLLEKKKHNQAGDDGAATDSACPRHSRIAPSDSCMAHCTHTRDSHASPIWLSACFFFFNDTATTEIYTLSLHDALPI